MDTLIYTILDSWDTNTEYQACLLNFFGLTARQHQYELWRAWLKERDDVDYMRWEVDYSVPRAKIPHGHYIKWKH